MDNQKKRKFDGQLTSQKKLRETPLSGTNGFGSIGILSQEVGSNPSDQNPFQFKPLVPISSNLRQTTIFESFGDELKITKRKTVKKPESKSERPVQKYQPSLEQMEYGRFGIEALSNSKSYGKSDITKQWRMKAIDHGYGGHGMDELQRTSYATKQLSVMSSNLSLKELRWQAFLLSMDRVDTSSLVWFTPEGGIGGHPGALRSPKQVKEKKGTTVTGHGSRDSNRVKALLSEPDDFSRFVRAKIETIRTMSTPREEFEDKRKKGFKTDLTHAIGGDLSKSGSFQAMSSYVGDKRELLKWDTASQLRSLKLDEHVPPVMVDYLKKNDNIPRLALLEWHKDLDDSSLKLEVNKTTSSQAGVLGQNETLSGTLSEVSKGSRPRSLSNPRRMNNPKI